MTHKDLNVWKRAVDFVTEIYRITHDYPKTEQYGLTSQIRRASISIPSNIAEGASREGKAEFKHFLYIALSSGSELETQLIISNKLGFLSDDLFVKLTQDLDTIQRMIQGLIKSIDK